MTSDTETGSYVEMHERSVKAERKAAKMQRTAEALSAENTYLRERVATLEELLVFADGAALTGLGMPLADLYAPDAPQQQVLADAGCHPWRGAKSVFDSSHDRDDPNADETPCPTCGHPALAHRKEWCDMDDCECPGLDASHGQIGE